MSKLILRSMFMAKTECLAKNLSFLLLALEKLPSYFGGTFFVDTLSTLLVNHNQPPYNHFQSLTYYLSNLKCDFSAQQKRQGLFHEEDEEAQGHPVSY